MQRHTTDNSIHTVCSHTESVKHTLTSLSIACCCMILRLWTKREVIVWIQALKEKTKGKLFLWIVFLTGNIPKKMLDAQVHCKYLVDIYRIQFVWQAVYLFTSIHSVGAQLWIESFVFWSRDKKKLILRLFAKPHPIYKQNVYCAVSKRERERLFSVAIILKNTKLMN